MQNEFQLAAIHGMMYTGGNIKYSTDGQAVWSPVLNNITAIHLKQGKNQSHRCCNSAVQCFDISEDGDLLMVVGSRGLGMFYSVSAAVVLDTISFPPSCSIEVVKFSPCGKYLAVGLENTLQIYTTPAVRVVSFHSCHRVENFHAALTSPIHTIVWSPDSEMLMLAGDDSRIKIMPRTQKMIIPDLENDDDNSEADDQAGVEEKKQPQGGKKKSTARSKVLNLENNLVGHRASVRLAAWGGAQDTSKVVSVASDSSVIFWKQTDVSRKELMAMVAEQKLMSRIEGYDSEDEDAVPPSFLETQKIKKLKKQGVRVKGEGAAGDLELPSLLKFAFETKKKFLLQHKGSLTVADYHTGRGLLALGYSSGTFAIHNAAIATDELPLVHLLSISSQSLTAAAFSPNGDHVAFGSSHLKQLFVWDWKSESYVIKEQSHYYDINRAALTSDGSTLVSGGDDGKVKVWNTSTGQCFATFADHHASITGIAINPTTNAVFTASKDGTLRAYDIVRYRHFRVFHPPQPTQFSCVTIDASGELIAAGSTVSNDIYLWSVQTGRIVEQYTGHEAPVNALCFHPAGTKLMSGSLDKTVVFWDVFNSTNEGERLRGHSETLDIKSEVLAVAFSRNGRLGAVLSMNTEINVFDFSDLTAPTLIKTFRTRYDATGGWTTSLGPNSANANNHFTTIAFNPDGTTLLAGGESKWLCLYHAKDGFLLKKWPVTTNLDVEGAEEQYQYKKQSEAGVIDEINVDEDDIHLRNRKVLELPGAKHRHHATGKRKTLLTARTTHVAFAEHGRDWVACTTDGLLTYSLDTARPKFNPLQLSGDVTPDTVSLLLQRGKWSLALAASLMLQDEKLAIKVMRLTPANAINVCVGAVPSSAFPTFVMWVAHEVSQSAYLEHAMLWARATLTLSDEPLFGHQRDAAVAPALRLLHRALHQHDGVAQTVDGNYHKLQYLVSSLNVAAKRRYQQASAGSAEGEGAAATE